MILANPDPWWLKVCQRPTVYDTKLPDFVDLGTNEMWDITDPVARIKKFTDTYNVQNSDERTDEYGFKKSIRVLPGLKRVIGNTPEDAPVPWGTYRYNRTPELLSACDDLIDLLLPKFAAATGTAWECPTIQVTGMHPGVILKPHIDGYWPHTIVEKIHIPLTTNRRCRQITFDPETAMLRSLDWLQPGNLYAINNLEPHSATNLGDEIRWHIIVDLVESAAWAEMKARARAEYPELASVYLVNPEYTKQCNDKFFALFNEVHGTLEPRRYVYSMFSGAPYYTKQNVKAEQ